MPCPMPWCHDPEPHRHLTRPVGPSFPADLPPRDRRKRAERAGWPADKVDRFVDNPHTDEFRAFDRTDTDAWLPTDAFWAWIRRLRTDPAARPYVLPAEFRGDDLDLATAVELTQRAFGRRPRAE